MGKEVLEYSKEELESLSYAELSSLLKEAEFGESLWNTKQMTLKIQINSLYGALANAYFPLFNEQMAAAITGNGRYFIQKLSNYIEEKLQSILPSQKEYIIYNDTDAAYYHIEPFMERYQEQNPNLSINEYVDWADNFEKKVIQPIIERCILDFATELNAYNHKVIGAEREIISDIAIFSAKKKYYARVRDSEGTRYSESDPKIKKMGLEVIKSSTPLWSIKKLEESIPKIFDGTETDLKSWVKSLREDFRNAPLQDISSVSSVKTVEYNPLDLDKNGKPKSINIGTKSAMAHNNYIKMNEIQHKYNLIQSGDKTKRLFLCTPNKFNSNIVAYTNESFTNEIDCVDYDTNFEKSFLNALQIMIESLGWDLTKKTETLDEW